MHHVWNKTSRSVLVVMHWFFFLISRSNLISYSEFICLHCLVVSHRGQLCNPMRWRYKNWGVSLKNITFIFTSVQTPHISAQSSLHNYIQNGFHYLFDSKLFAFKVCKYYGWPTKSGIRVNLKLQYTHWWCFIELQQTKGIQ